MTFDKGLGCAAATWVRCGELGALRLPPYRAYGGRSYDGLGMFDAVLAATAILSGADALVSADRAFKTVRGLTPLDPAGPQVQHLIKA